VGVGNPSSNTERGPLTGDSVDQTEPLSSEPDGDGPDGGVRLPELPERVGAYRILGKLGEGGMGVVYEAQQESPRRRVAVKVGRGGGVHDDVLLRMFRREVESLARLQHPNIGGIFESGVTEDGRHFFAMELVRGATLNAYLASRGPVSSDKEVRFRLALFRRIADAVHYAHQRGVIHRDLKPSNIIVTDEGARETTVSGTGGSTTDVRFPETKILDFGLARITGGDVAGATMATEVGAIRGTLAYMSPEQTRGLPEDVDLRTDIYALGVILYEMLSGRRPYDVKGASLVEAIRLICYTPPTPLREAMRESFRLDSDIETIVGKAMEKEPDRRYASAEALSQDVARYLASQPILARPPSATYQLRKFAARNRALVGGVLTAIGALLASVLVATTFAVREAAERRQADQARLNLEAVADFQAKMLSAVKPDEIGRRLLADLQERTRAVREERGASNTEVEEAAAALDAALDGVNPTGVALRLIDREILGRSADTIEERFADQPLIDARLRDTIGETYSTLGMLREAEPHLMRAWQLRRELLGEEHQLTLSSMGHVADLYWRQGRLVEAEELAARVLDGTTRVLGEEHPDTLAAANGLALVYADMGRLADVERLYNRTLDVQRRVMGEEHPDTLATMNNLGVLYKEQGRLEAAARQLRETLEIRRRVLGNEHRQTAATLSNLATTEAILGHNAEAGALFTEALTIQTKLLGEEHPDTLSVMNNLGLVETNQGRFADAESTFVRTLTLQRRVLGEDHLETLVTMNNLSNLYVVWKRLAEAERLDLETLAIRRRVLGDDHPDTLVSLNNLAVLYRDQGRYREAEPLFLEALEKRERVTGLAHPDTARVRTNLMKMYQAEGRVEDAQRLAVDMLTAAITLADREDATAYELNDCAWQLLTIERVDLRDPERALRFARRASAKEEDASGPELWNYLDTLALALHMTGDSEGAIETERRALTLLSDDRPERAGILQQIAVYEAAVEGLH
jgi:serine/threonine protein kinase/tetratricopeptide (TPR) repeat protein